MGSSGGRDVPTLAGIHALYTMYPAVEVQGPSQLDKSGSRLASLPVRFFSTTYACQVLVGRLKKRKMHAKDEESMSWALDCRLCVSCPLSLPLDDT